MSILITGTSSGFGKLTAIALARKGESVIATMRNLDKSEDLLRLAKEEKLSIEVRELDVCNPESVKVCLDEAQDIHALINNAGFEVQAAIEQLDDELMIKQLDTNVMGPLRTMRAVLPAWRERGSGVIVNVSSIAGRVAPPYSGAYAASKHALEAMSESLHFEVSQLGIRVSLIEPGRFPTNFGENIIRPASWEGSEYEKRCESFRVALMKLDNNDDDTEEGLPSGPELVVDAIMHAIADPSTPFRVLVGADAEMIDAAKTSMDFENFETTMRTVLDWND